MDGLEEVDSREVSQHDLKEALGGNIQLVAGMRNRSGGAYQNEARSKRDTTLTNSRLFYPMTTLLTSCGRRELQLWLSYSSDACTKAEPGWWISQQGRS